MNKERSNTPLYKVLKQEITQGEFEVLEVFVPNMIVRTEQTKYFFAEFSGEKGIVNAQYTALAVNNLHHLAEALEPFIKLADAVLKNNLKRPYEVMYGYNGTVIHLKDLIAAKEALNKIS